MRKLEATSKGLPMNDRWWLYIKRNGVWEWLQSAPDIHAVRRVEAQYQPGTIKRLYRGQDLFLVQKRK